MLPSQAYMAMFFWLAGLLAAVAGNSPNALPVEAQIFCLVTIWGMGTFFALDAQDEMKRGVR